MKVRLAIAASLFLGASCGQLFSADSRTLRSHSGQFLVSGQPMGAPLLAPATNAEVSYVRLDPTLLAVSCERIKAAVLAELAMKDSWRGKIFISLHPVHDDHEAVLVTAVHFTDGWNYQMEIPEQVDRKRLVRSVIEVLVLEMANRNAGALSAEPPLWLVEGLAANLQAAALSGLTLEPETRLAQRGRGHDPLGRARQWLRTHAPLSLNELNWPAEEQLSDENIETYRSCAQVFVYELLRLRDGRACLRDMLARLPEKLNWQTVFLDAFSAHFQRLIDVDKWWSLHVVRLLGQGFVSSWAPAEICRQLEDILATSAQVRVNPKEMPLLTQVKLQSIVAEWDFPRQQPVLRQKLNLLQALRLRATPEAYGLVEDYRQTIDAYLQRRSKSGGSDRKNAFSPNLRLLLGDMVKRLDALDARREALCGETGDEPAPVPEQTAK